MKVRSSNLRRIRVVASDLDGTLLAGDDSVSDHTIEVIRTLRESGVETMLISGRSDGFVRSYSRAIGTSMPVISLNGALIKNAAGSVVDAAFIRPDWSRAIMHSAEKFHDLEVAVFTPDGIYTEAAQMQLPRYLLACPAEQFRVKSVMDHLEHAVLFIFTGPFNSIQAVSMEAVRQFRGHIERSMYQSRSGRDHYYLELKLAGINKGIALRTAAQSLGISRNETAAIGDFSNDVEMLRYAGVSAAMRNSSEDIKRLADFVTLKTNNEDGVAEFLEFILRSRK